MTGSKTKTGKRTMRKPAKRPSPALRLLRFFFTSASSLAIVAGDFIVRNPVMTGGATAFMVVLSFVSANALWYQPEAHQSVFFRTRPDFVFKPTPRAVLPGTAAARSADAEPAEQVAAATQPAAEPVETADVSPDRLNAVVDDDMLPALAPKADLEIARLQQRLSMLGIYKGPVDGFTGPQTREAVDRWRALQKKLGVAEASVPAGVAPEAPQEDAIAKAIEVAVPTPRPQPQPVAQPVAQPVVRKAETPAKPKPDLASFRKPETVSASPAVQTIRVSSQDIVRVQAGLKAFGNDTVPVNGQPGKATEAAVRQFQKMFGLRVTGQIDEALIGKMREIGLIS